MVTSFPTFKGQPGSVCKTLPSWTFDPSPINIFSTSPLKTALNQILVFFSKVTSPIMVALGATQFSPEFFGFLSFNS